MPSRADGRRRLESALRALAVVALATALLVSWRSARRAPTGEAIVLQPEASALRDTSGVALARAVARALAATVTAAGDPGGASSLAPSLAPSIAPSRTPSLTLSLVEVPGPAARAVLAAVQAAGLGLAWRSTVPLPALAVAATRDGTPGAGTVLRIAAPPAVPVVLRDGGGLLDSLPEGPGIVSLRVGDVVARLVAATAGAHADVPVEDSLAARRVLLLARAGWEARFTVAALEEDGWSVDASLAVAPGVVVTAGSTMARPDTARLGVVVVLDSGVVDDAGRLATFVRSGGGLVLAGDALGDPTLAPLRPARPGARRIGIPGGLRTPLPRSGLDRDLLVPVAGAFVLERAPWHDADVHDRSDASNATVVARRIGAGRVVAIGYRATWRWRMEGDDDAPQAHRAWWSRVVAGVALAAPTRAPAADRASRPDPRPGHSAPLADLVALAGPPAPPTDSSVLTGPDGAFAPPGRRPTWPFVLVAMGALLAEWTSRRLGGRR
jgi:hypothetical protein